MTAFLLLQVCLFNNGQATAALRSSGPLSNQKLFCDRVMVYVDSTSEFMWHPVDLENALVCDWLIFSDVTENTPITKIVINAPRIWSFLNASRLIMDLKWQCRWHPEYFNSTIRNNKPFHGPLNSTTNPDYSLPAIWC